MDYLKTFLKLGLTPIALRADSGAIGGNLSHEFQILAKTGESTLYYDKQLDLVKKLWENLLYDFEKKGNRFQKIRSVFSQGIGEYWSAYKTAAKFIGGIHFSRNHIGDPNQKNPLIVVESEKQREALYFINNRIFHKNAFDFDQNLLNKLAPERHEDFRGYVWRMDRLDYPIHTVIKRIQSNALFTIFHPRRILRLQDNELRVLDNNLFTMAELFNSINARPILFNAFRYSGSWILSTFFITTL